MNVFLRGIYLFVLQPLMLFYVLFIGSLFSKKIRKGLGLRQLMPWTNIPKNLKPIWIHCSSGEFEYTKALLREIKKHDSTSKILVTYFSPTYTGSIARDPNVDFSCPLPFDLPGPSRSFIKQINPKVLLISRTDIWPELTLQCQKLQVKTILFSATFNKKLNFVTTAIHQWRYSNINSAYTVSEDDKKNLKALMPKLQVEAIGDTRYDQAFFRIQQTNDQLKANLFKVKTPLFIAGSTWPEDEKIIIPGLKQVLTENKIKLVITPHEPTKNHITQIEKRLKEHKLSFQHYSNSEKFTEQVLIIDKVGLLANIYPLAKFSFIGGSFKSSVHSVMESLVAGNIVFVGPFIQNNREALVYCKKPLNDRLMFVNSTANLKEFKDTVNEAINCKSSFSIANIMSNECGASKRLVDILINEKLI